MYRIPIYTLALVREKSHTAPVRIVQSPYDAYEVLRDLLETADREQFLVIMLDTRHRVIGINIASVGTLNASLVHPREVFKPAFLCNAAALILAHNHPSGDPTPSSEDLALTSRLVQTGELVGIAVLDHVILGDGQFASLKERRLM